ncbi:DNA helicase-2 / ATP-dependent DNA helicase PcrA [Propionispira arboris]|uniref:DNA 3'-5' helicase n=1 Tax=Propionispira arboris TaxID=84035 RepID=A0A1H6ZLA4_9FIRM|nr:ATP-dependent helicase [Propionispira arboris]SEJ54181.1 DNA helicase-2 / ATP-dependent DNA helicase PcrA [Propionispira arboris]
MAINLSNTQKAVVDYLGDNLLVIAGAGSGKTRVLTERIKRLILILKKGEKVLAITFSNKAAEELKGRLVETLGEQKLNECTYIGTIHKFCLDIVTSRSSAIGLPDELHICDSYNDRLQIFKEAIESIPQIKAKYIGTDTKENQKKIKKLLDNLSNAKRNLKFAGDYANKPLIQKLFEEYDNMLIQQGVIDFDDILRYSYQILTERESVARLYRKIYKYICIDEAQDLNKAQYEIIKALAGNEIGVTMVGDPNQSIYGFNGSTSDYIERLFLDDFKAEKIELNENYRSSKKIIEAAKKIESSFEVYGVCKYEGEFEIFNFDDEKKEAEFIVEKIKRLIKNGHPDVENNDITLEQCAIIARNRYIFKYIEELLKANKMEYTLKASAKGSFSSESDFVKAFELGIRLLVNSKDKIHLVELSKLVSSKKKYKTFEELKQDKDLSEQWVLLLNILRSAWAILLENDNEIKFHIAIKKLKNYMNNSQLNLDDHELILISEDLKAWEEHWNCYVKNSSAGERSLANFVRTVSLGSTNISEDKGIVLTTVHMSKGLQYDVVFIMGLNEGVFPDYRAVYADDNSKDNKQLIEERHNMFVAITRSKRLCYLTYPLLKNTNWGVKVQKPSRYILELSGIK